MIVQSLMTKPLSFCNPFPLFPNLGLYVIDGGATKKQIVISKIRHKISQKEYARYANVRSTLQQLFCDTLSTVVFADMNNSSNPILNKTAALKMHLHLETKYNKFVPGHIQDILTTFQQGPDPNKALGNYLEKQYKDVSLLENSAESIIDATKIRTAQGQFIKLLYLQQAVVDFNKEELVWAKTWDETCFFFVAKDLEYKDNQGALSNARTANSVTPSAGVTNQIH